MTKNSRRGMSRSVLGNHFTKQTVLASWAGADIGENSATCNGVVMLFADMASFRRKVVCKQLLEIDLHKVKDSLLLVLVILYSYPGFTESCETVMGGDEDDWWLESSGTSTAQRWSLCLQTP